ncbi:MAG: nucleoside deaminase [Burkholderiaceae bacterium]|nr:nucleoside deaminase [Burkholderiaceae bacterium]
MNPDTDSTAAGIDLGAMRRAIAASRQALADGNMPFGASLVAPSGALLWVAQNDQVTSGDCTGHAELVLVREVTRVLGAPALRGATVYASGEPCAMCSGAMFWAGVARIVFAASQADIIRTLGGATLPITCAQVLQGASPALRVDGPVLQDEAVEVLEGFARPRAA